MELKEALAITLALLSPLAVYCLVLSFVNRRPRPLLVSGPLDFLGVLLALSGFLVVGGPAALSTLVANWHGLDQMAPPGLGRPDGGWGRILLGVLLALYAVGVVGGVVVMLRRRRRMTAVYNVDPAEFDAALGRVFDGLGYSWTRSGNRYYVRAGTLSPAGKGPAGDSLPEAHDAAHVIEVEPSPGLWHVLLLWGQTAPAVRREVEGELGRTLGQVRSGPNPAGGWFLSAASMLFLLLFAVLLLLLAADVLWRGA
jgi:hypothetical protein